MNASQRRKANRKVMSMVGKTVTILPTCWVRSRYGISEGVVMPSPVSAYLGIALVKVQPIHGSGIDITRIALKSLRVRREVQEG